MPTILLVEDNKLSQKMMFYTFRNEGITADYADDGVQADKMAREKNYDIILMDIMMPNMDGYETTRYIRDYEKKSFTGHRSIIIGLTGNVYDQEREKCIKAGMDDFMVKPFDFQELKQIAAHHNILL